MATDLTLVIANKTYSSWSLRPWLAMTHFDVPFKEIVIPLHQGATSAKILTHSPAGKVPILHHGDITVWESIAILEYLAESFYNQFEKIFSIEFKKNPWVYFITVEDTEVAPH